MRNKNEYIYGNVVRKEYPVYERPRKQTHVKVQQKKAVETRSSIASFDFLLMVPMVAAVIMILAICYNYLTLTSSISEHLDTIKTMETELEDLKTENDSFEQSIDTSVDLNEVYRIAITELGMIHPGKDNIITYNKTESEYVRQYEDIPKLKD